MGFSYIAKDLSDWPDGLFNKNKIDCTNFWTNFVLIADMKHPKRFDTGLVFEKVLTTFFLVRLVYEKLFDFKLWSDGMEAPSQEAEKKNTFKKKKAKENN